MNEAAHQICVRRVPIHFPTIAEESGMTRGKVAKSTWAGWVVMNTTKNPDWPDMATITPPLMLPGETDVRVEGNMWCFYGPNAAGEPLSPAK